MAEVEAPSWNGDPSRIGVYGSSSGGHAAQLLALRPDDPRYKKKITLVPMLIIAGSLDDNVLPEFQKKFAASYRGRSAATSSSSSSKAPSTIGWLRKDRRPNVPTRW